MIIIIIVLILLLYYFCFISFLPPTKKPLHISNKVVDFQGNVYENDKFISKTKDPFDYTTQTSLKPFSYSIDFQNNELTFKVLSKEIKLPITNDYYWDGHQIMEKDECYGKGPMVEAKGRKLFNYVRKNDLFDGPLSQRVKVNDMYRYANVFYFKCVDNKIRDLHKCPPGHIFDLTQCKNLDQCTGKHDTYKYKHPDFRYKYYECLNETSIEKLCPPGLMFFIDKCVKPNDLCEFKPDGFTYAFDYARYYVCINHRSVMKRCEPKHYFKDGKCLPEICKNKNNELVPSIHLKLGPFSYTPFYGTCKDGMIFDVRMCPLVWDHYETNVNLTHLSQVFNPITKKCEIPKLCENVKIVNNDFVIPAYKYAKHLNTWPHAEMFDNRIGYKCNSQNLLQQVNIPDNSIIVNYKLVKCKKTKFSKLPVFERDKYYDCTKDTIESCSPNHFFNGIDCVKEIENAFKFETLDIFKFDGLNRNNWIKPRSELGTDQVDCEPQEKYIVGLNACADKGCERFYFTKSLKRPIFINDTEKCEWEEPKIKKKRYEKPYLSHLHFWEQTFVTDSSTVDQCTFGNKVKTGNFVLDSTLYMTCALNQPFVFCPSSSTDSIEKVNNFYACKPKNDVYTYKLSAMTQVELGYHEVSHISMLSGTQYTFEGSTQTTPQNQSFTLIMPTNKSGNFSFQANQDTIIHLQTLENDPPNTFIRNRIIQSVKSNSYSIRKNKRTSKSLNFIEYDIKDKIVDFEY